ncbi:MAG: cytochrome c oxidase subunit II [Blastocatellales bacterium]
MSFISRQLVGHRALALALCFTFTFFSTSFAQPPGELPKLLHNVGIEQRLNAQVQRDLVFRDETGKAVRLDEYLKDKPVILAMTYFECPMLCTQVLNGLVKSLNAITFDVGNQFNVLTISFDPRDTPGKAAKEKDSYLRRYGRAGAQSGWRFLTGSESSIKALTEAVGFRYAYDSSLDQYAHASGLIILTPEGRVSRYFYGINYKPMDLRLGLIEAADGKIGTPVDQMLLFCYHYDPKVGKYSPVVMNILRGAAALTLLFLVCLLLLLKRGVVRARIKTKTTDTEIGQQSLCVAPTLLLLQPFMPEQASTVAGDVDRFYYFMVAISALLALAVAGLEIYFAVKYRRRARNEVPRQILGSIRLESLTVVFLFILFMVMFVWGASLYFKLYRPPLQAMEVYVTGKQWMWRFQHPEGVREINELHVPVGRRVKLVMTSEDVIHSFFVPAFRVKSDVIPGRERYTTVWFEATKPGRYRIFCAEYCGTDHSKMGGWVTVMEPAEYQAWLTGGGSVAVAGQTMASSGEALFQSLGCASCHSGSPLAQCPTLIGLFGKTVALQTGQIVKADESYIRESILNPQTKLVAGYQPVMPTFQGIVTEEQTQQLIAYIRTLSPEQAPSAEGSPKAGGQTSNPQQQRSNPTGATSQPDTNPPINPRR